MHGRREKNAAHFWSGGQAIKCVCFEGRTSSTQRCFGDRQALGGFCGKGRNRPEADSRPPRAANNADLPAGISALAVPARQKLRPIGVAAVGCPALAQAWSAERCSAGGCRDYPTATAAVKKSRRFRAQRRSSASSQPALTPGTTVVGRFEARAAKVERALGPNNDCAPPG